MICSKRCVTANGLRKHQQYSHSPNSQSLKRPTQVSIEQPAIKKPCTNPSKPPVQRVNCRRCNESFNNKLDLYLYGMQRHYQIGQGTQLQASPYGQGPYPWEIGDENDLALKEVYEANAPLILENHREGPIHSVYNIPLTNDVDMHQLMLAVEKEKRYRFFKPYENDSVFHEPLFISKRGDIDKLRRKLTDLNLREYLIKERPDTKWKPFLVTNVLFVIDTTNYMLGKGETPLPDYIKQKSSIYALVKDKKKSKAFTDKLCAFRCLELHRGQSITNLERSLQHYFQQWNGYQERQIESTYEAKLFSGLQLHQIPEFESCFQVNINVYELKEDDTAFCVYKSLCRFKEIMYLNMYEHHLSYIKEFENYAKNTNAKQANVTLIITVIFTDISARVQIKQSTYTLRWSEDGDFNHDEDECKSIDGDNEENQPPKGDQSILNGNKIMENQLKSLYGQLEEYMTKIPVLGFNSGKYDLNLINQKLAMFVDMHVEEDRPFVVKKNNMYACIS
ncbi:unnamed protein product [Mytilus coruscus]|uniref:Uncharacterized protein n=1 Tax=Mytilus coruscus TaxID=42192 RepID=A0A6J8DAT5_MYTCO|nr:unnamed protein product [Mytilus coruscus]